MGLSLHCQYILPDYASATNRDFATSRLQSIFQVINIDHARLANNSRGIRPCIKCVLINWSYQGQFHSKRLRPQLTSIGSIWLMITKPF